MQTSTVYQPPSITSNNNEVTSYSRSIEIPISEDCLSKSRKLERHLVLMKSHVKLFLNSLFIPTVWKLATIVPFPKSSMKDPNNPMQYRGMGISLLSIPYMLVTKILNNVLCEWLEGNIILLDTQCGFRAGRSIYHRTISEYKYNNRDN